METIGLREIGMQRDGTAYTGTGSFREGAAGLPFEHHEDIVMITTNDLSALTVVRATSGH